MITAGGSPVYDELGHSDECPVGFLEVLCFSVEINSRTRVPVCKTFVDFDLGWIAKKAVGFLSDTRLDRRGKPSEIVKILDQYQYVGDNRSAGNEYIEGISLSLPHGGISRRIWSSMRAKIQEEIDLENKRREAILQEDNDRALWEEYQLELLKLEADKPDLSEEGYARRLTALTTKYGMTEKKS